MNKLQSFFNEIADALPLIIPVVGVGMILFGVYLHESGQKSTWLHACVTLTGDQVKCELLQALR